jgi:XapX domain-containing protein
MVEVLLALGVGILVGVIFSFFKLPLPAPPVLSAVMGVVGIYCGGVIYQWVVQNWMTK